MKIFIFTIKLKETEAKENNPVHYVEEQNDKANNFEGTACNWYVSTEGFHIHFKQMKNDEVKH